MYAQLGDIRFEELKGFASLSDKKEALYAEHALIDGKPRLQRVGNALDEFTIGLHFHVAFCDPEAEYDKLNRYRDDGEILALVYGTGYYEGTFVITTLNRTVNDTDKNGAYIDIDVSVGLREFYQADQMKNNQKRALLSAFAVSSNRPLPINVPPPALTPDALALQSIQKTNLAKGNIARKISEVQASINAPVTLLLQGQAFAANSVDTAKNLVANSLTMATGLSRVGGIIGAFPSILLVSPALGTSLASVLAKKLDFDNSIAAFLGLPTVNSDLTAQYALDIFNVTLANNLLLAEALKQFTQSATPLIALKSLRKKLF